MVNSRQNKRYYLYSTWSHVSFFQGYRGSCRIRFNQQPSAGNQISPFNFDVAGSPSFQSQPNIPSANDNIIPSFQPARNRMLLPQREDPSIGDQDMDLQRIINSFQQDFELDLRKQLWEILQVPRVPQLGLGRPARFIHDFSLVWRKLMTWDISDNHLRLFSWKKNQKMKTKRKIYKFIYGSQFSGKFFMLFWATICSEKITKRNTKHLPFPF